MKSAFKLTVLLVTYRRARQCRDCLLSLFEALDHSPEIEWDILVGINGPDEETRRELSRFASPRVRIMESHTRLTPAAYRNLLFQSATGDWIFFVDDDAYVPPKFFASFSKARARWPSYSVFGGPNLNPPGSSLFQRSSGIALASQFATFFSASRYSIREIPKACDERSLTLCNLFVRRAVLDQDPFPPAFVCCEENWMLQNLEKKGCKAVYHPSLMVWHDRRPDLISLSRQIFRYGFGRGQIFKRRIFGVRPAHLLPLVCVAYTVFALWFLLARGSLPPAIAMPFAAYAAVCILSAAIQKFVGRHSVAEVAVSASLYPVVHVSYGCGLFWGIVRG